MQKRDATPKSELEDFTGKTFLVSTLHGLHFGNVTIDEIPELEAAEGKDFSSVFAEKCKQCCKLCDFSKEEADQSAKELKTKYLAEFEKVFVKPRFVRIIGDEEIKEFLRMCKVNIGRSYASLKVVSSIECPDNVLDTSWPHLNAVYKAMKALFSSKIASNLSDPTLLAILVTNTFSCDERERQCVKECLTMWYGKVPDDKVKMIKATVDQIRTGDCSGELLGFVYDFVPDIGKLLPDKKLEIFMTVVRLHNSPLFMKFATSLTQCMTRFIRDDNSLINVLFRYLMSHWPTFGIKKQVKFTEELESIMENFPDVTIERDTAKALFDRLSVLCLDPGVDIAEAALSFVIGQGNEATLIKYIDLAMTQMVPKLNTCRKDHWNVFIRDDARLILDLLSKASPALFSQEVDVVKGLRKANKARDTKRLNSWQEVMKTAKKKDPHIHLSQIALI